MSHFLQVLKSKTQILFTTISTLVVLIFGLSKQSTAQNYQSFRGTGTALTGNNFTAASATNACVAGPYTASLAAGNIAYFCVPSGTASGAGGITVGGMIATENLTLSSPSGTLSTGGTVITVNVASGKTLDLSTLAISTAAGTGFIKTGAGAYATNGGNFTSGFTVNGGTMILRGINALGNGGALTLNAGTIAANNTRDLSGKFTGGITIGGDIQFGEVPANVPLASNTANLTFSNNIAIGATTRTLTLGNAAINTFSSIFSGTGGINFAANSNGTGGSFVLTGANTYSGTTTVSGGTVRLSRTGGTTIPIGNSVVVSNGATLNITTAQQLNNVTIDAGGTLILNATLTVSGTATINGTLQIGQGGFATTTGGGSYTYGSNGTLAYNLTASTYGPVDAGHVYWPATNGPANVTMTGTGTAAVNMGVARTVPGTFLLVSGTNMVQGTALTLNGTVQINGGNFQTTPTYGASSTLVYNTTYGTSNEWTGGASTSVAAGSGIPANVQVLSGTVTLAGGRGVPGNVTVTAGGLVLNATSGDLYIGGNLTHSGTVWTNNSRAVVFVGTGTSTINTTANSGVQFFDYLLINKSAGSVQLGSATNVTLNSTAGDVLQFLNAGSLDLNGRTLTLNGINGNILVNGATGGTTKNITSSTPATISITGNKAVVSSNAGTLTLDNNISVITSANINFNGGTTTLNGTLQINASGSATAPFYGASSTLIYNSGGTYGRSLEWTATSGAGYPNNVTLSNNTNLNLVGTNSYTKAAGNLTVNTGSTFTVSGLTSGSSGIGIEFGGNIDNSGTITLSGGTNQRLKANNLTNSGTVNLSATIGGDLELTGNYTDNATFTANQRAVFFTGTGTQTISGSATAPFNIDYIVVTKASGIVQLGVNLLTGAPNGGNGLTLSNTTDILDLNGNTFTLGTVGQTCTISGNGFIRGSSSSSMIINGTGDAVGTLKFESGNRALSNLTVNRTSSGVVTLGTDLTVGTTLALTNGALSINGNTLTIDGAVTGTGTLTGSNSSNLTVNGAAGTLLFTSGSTNNYLKNFTIGASGSATLGNALNITGGASANNEGTLTVSTTSGVGLTTGGFLTIKSNSFGTARIAAGNTSGGYISGNVTVERFINQYGNKAWRLLASNTSGQTINQAWQEGAADNTVDPSPGFGTVITSSGASTAAVRANGFDTLSQGISILKYTNNNDGFPGLTSTNVQLSSEPGYFLFVRGDRSNNGYVNTNFNNVTAPLTSTVLRSTGSLFLGDQTAVNVGAGGYSLLRNPYPSRIDLRNVQLSGAITDAFDVWDPQLSDGGFGVGGFQTFTKSGSDYVVSPGGGSYGANGSVNNFVESGMAFYIKGSTSGSAQVTEACKATGSSVVNRPANPTSNNARLLFNLKANAPGNNSILDGGFFDFDNANSNAVDYNDVRKNLNFTTNFGIATANTYDLIVERRAMPVATDTLFFKMDGLSARAYQLSFSPENLLATGLVAILEDTYLNTSTPVSLLNNSTFNFEVTNVAASAAAKRFRIVFKPQAPLPVSINNISAYQQANNIVVEWKVSNQLNVNNYEIQKSTDGRTFVSIGNQLATGNSQTDITYNFVDVNVVSGANYYRIKSVDNNGAYKYTIVVRVIIGKFAPSVTVSPNPVRGNNVNIQFVNEAAGTYQVRIVNSIGQIVLSKQLVHTGGSATQKLDLPGNLINGVYQLQVIEPNQQQQVQKLIINTTN